MSQAHANELAPKVLVWGVVILTLGFPYHVSGCVVRCWGIVVLDVPYRFSRKPKKHVHEALLHKVNDGFLKLTQMRLFESPAKRCGLSGSPSKAPASSCTTELCKS